MDTFYPPRALRVLIVDGELGASELADRVIRICDQLQVDTRLRSNLLTVSLMDEQHDIGLKQACDLITEMQPRPDSFAG